MKGGWKVDRAVGLLLLGREKEKESRGNGKGVHRKEGAACAGERERK